MSEKVFVDNSYTQAQVLELRKSNPDGLFFDVKNLIVLEIETIQL